MLKVQMLFVDWKIGHMCGRFDLFLFFSVIMVNVMGKFYSFFVNRKESLLFWNVGSTI